MSKMPGIGPHFHEVTKYSRHNMGGLTTWARQVPKYKQYEAPLETLTLPPPQVQEGPPLWHVIQSRRSWRNFSDTPLPLQHLSQILWAIQGVTDQSEHELRATASAGALYPNETYVFANNVSDCLQGIWHYEVREHRLVMLAEGNFGPSLAEACLGQRYCAAAPVVFAFGAVVDRCAWKYGDRAYRYIYTDAGHLGGQLQLAATALGLGSVNMGAFFDDEVNSLLGLDGTHETAVYLAAVGLPL